MFTCAVCKCVGCVSEVMENIRVDKEMQEKFPSSLLTEWDEFFSPSVYNTLLPLYITNTGKLNGITLILKFRKFNN